MKETRTTSWLLGGLAVAVVARAALSGPEGAASVPAAALFALAGSALALITGWRPGRPGAAVLWGLAGGAVLVAGPVIARTDLAGGTPTVTWGIVVTAVAVSEEALLRGALWAAAEKAWGPVAALALTTVVFALMHVPLYGWRALPLDLAVGLVLGGLRAWTRGWGAPALAHVIADLAGGWV